MNMLGAGIIGILGIAYMGVLIAVLVFTIMLMVRGYKALELYIKKTKYELEQIEQGKKNQTFND